MNIKQNTKEINILNLDNETNGLGDEITFNTNNIYLYMFLLDQ